MAIFSSSASDCPRVPVQEPRTASTLDHARALTLVVEHGRVGETYNVGGRNERTNMQAVTAICDLLDRDAGVNAWAAL